jgi:hypothetical protein
MTLNPEKRTLLVMLIIMMVAVLVLASGLTGMEMDMGGFFGVSDPDTGLGLIFGEGAGADPVVVQMLALLAVIAIPLSIVMFIVSPEMRKRVLRDGLVLALFAAVFLIIFQRNPQLGELTNEFQEPDTTMPEEGERTDPGDLVLNPPPWAMWVASGLVLAVGGYAIWRYLQTRQEPYDGIYEDLRLETQEAMDRLRAGENVRELVTRCYIRMHAALADARGVTDSDLLTPREFERRMMDVTGLPAEPINRLTRLFERVRYGDQDATEAEKEEAVNALETINKALNR